MSKTLRIPNEPRFVRAFALAVDPGDTLSLLLEIGALGNQDLTLVRRTREALEPAYHEASDRKDWEQVHTISILRQALAEPDPAAYLAYQVASGNQGTHLGAEFTEALAVVGCAADSLSTRQRPWEVESNDLSLPDWRRQIWNLLFAMTANTLPKPSDPSPSSYDDGEAEDPKALAEQATVWCVP